MSGPARVIDADTLEVGGKQVELFGLDAPQMGQECELNGMRYDCGLIAAGRLAELAAGHIVRCEALGPGNYTHVIGACVAGGRDLAEELVRAGWALAYTRYSDKFLAAEEEASREKRGLWRQTSAKPSWSWR